MTDMDAYYAAFDIHGEKMECSQCGAELDSIYVSHWGRYTGINGVEESVPICDRCYYDECARDFDRDDDLEDYA
jgi:hypothetical protein